MGEQPHETSRKSKFHPKEIAELEEEVANQKDLIEKLKKLKPAKEVAAVELASLPASDAFEELTDSVSRAFEDLPGIVGEALYYNQRCEELPCPRFGYSGAEDTLDDIRGAIEEGYLVEGDPGFEIADESPPVEDADRVLLVSHV